MKQRKRARSAVSGMSLFGGLVLSMSAAMAGGKEGGNGGLAFVCRNQAGQVASAELADFFEAENDPTIGLKIVRSPEAWDRQLSAAIDRLEKVFPTLGFDARYFRKAVHDSFVALPINAIAVDPGDYNILVRKRGCPLEVVALHKEGKILLNQEVYDELPPTDQAGLHFHELLYWVGRENRNLSQSDPVRRLTSGFFSDLEDSSMGLELGKFVHLVASSIREGRVKAPVQHAELILRKTDRIPYRLGISVEGSMPHSDRAAKDLALYEVSYSLERNGVIRFKDAGSFWREDSIDLAPLIRQGRVTFTVTRLRSSYADSALALYLWNDSTGGGQFKRFDMNRNSVLMLTVTERDLSE